MHGRPLLTPNHGAVFDALARSGLTELRALFADGKVDVLLAFAGDARRDVPATPVGRDRVPLWRAVRQAAEEVLTGVRPELAADSGAVVLDVACRTLSVIALPDEFRGFATAEECDAADRLVLDPELEAAVRLLDDGRCRPDDDDPPPETPTAPARGFAFRTCCD